MATPAAVLNILLTANTAQANAALAKTQGQLMATSKTASATSATMKRAMGGIVVAAGAAAYGLYKIGEEFDQAYDKIRVGTGATGKELKKLETSFKNVVQDVPASFEDASTAIADLNTRMSLSGKPLERMTKQVTELSRITKTDVSGNVESISKAFVDWEVKTKDMGKTLDGFFRVSQESGASVAELTDAVQKFGSPLRQLGFDLDEAASMWATFVRAGVNTQTMVPGLKLALASLNAPTDDLRAKMEDLGIAIGKPEKGIQQVFDLLGNKSTLSQIDKTTLAMEVFGKRAGADMAEAIRQGRFEVEDMLKTFRNGKDTIRGAGRDTMDLSERWQQFTNILKVRLQPVAEDVFKGLADLMKDVTKAFKADGWEGVFDLLMKKLNDALPKIQDVAIKIGGNLAEGIVKGFQQAPVLTGLLVGGAMLKMFGGGSAIGAAGKVLGKKFGGGFGAGLVLTGVAAFAQLYAEGKRTLEGHGSKSLSEMFEGEFENIGKAIRTSIKEQDLDGLIEIQKLLDAMRDSAINSGERVPKALDKVIDAADEARSKIGADLKGAIDKFDDFTDGGGKMAANFDKTVDKMANDADRFKGAFTGAFKKVAGGISSLDKGIGKGLDNIGSNTNSLLKGLKVGEVSYSIKKVGESLKGFQRGGPINMGAPSGDTVPAMLERGEYVLNRNAVSRLGKDKLDAINFGAAPRFQTGGMAGLQPGIARLAQYANERLGLQVSSGVRSGPAGASWHNTGEAVDLVPPSMGATKSIFNAFKSQLEELFYDPWGGYDSGQMIGPIGGHMDHIHAAILGAGSGAAVGSSRVKRMLLKGPKGPLRSAGQAALDKARAAANAFIRKQSSHSDIGAGGGALSEGQFLALAKQAIGITDRSSIWGGSDGFSASGLLTLAKAESSLIPSSINNWDINAQMGNPSGGLMHLTQSNMKAYAEPSLTSNMFDPLSSIAASINYQIDRYGGQVTHSPYQRGGLVQKLAKGGQAGKPGLKINPPKGMGLQITGPAAFPGWSQANTAASLAAALTTKLNEIASLDETLSLEQMLADRDGVFTAAEIQSQIALNAKLLPVLTAARDIAKAGAATVFGGLSVAKGPNRAALIDMAPGFTDAITEMQGVTGKGGRIFETWMEIARLKSTAPDVPGARGSVLDAIESQIALAGLTPELTDDIAGYTALVHYWETLLASLQSSGAPFGDIGSAASSLKSARDALAALTGTTDGGGSSIESDINALKLAQAMDTIRRLNVGIAQNSVFAGTFATGGTIPNGAWGIAGERGPEIIHGPATVHSNSDSQSMLSPEVRVVIEDNRTIVSVDGQVEAIVDNKLNQIARSRSYAGAGRL